MESGKASRTAVSAALFRAAHLHLYGGPTIHEDRFALQLTGIGGLDELRAVAVQIERTGFAMRRAAAYFAFRHQFSEERMVRALDRGVDQVVLLGAGLDSLALRAPALPARVRFVEIDHPDSQRWKLERLTSLGLDTPGVRYVPVDFTSHGLDDGLAAANVDVRKPVFVAWLGVTQYIPKPATERTLTLVAGLAPGSEIVFDVILPLDAQPPADREMSAISAAFSAEHGEPWLAYFSPEEIERMLASLGFHRVDRFAAKAVEPYYVGQPAEIRPLDGWQMVAATV